MKLGYCSITWGGVVGDPTGVTSIKDLFYRANGDALKAIADIGEVGYQGTEMFDGNVADFADRPDELTGALAAAGLELVSVYTGANFIYADVLPDELHRVRRAAQLAAQFAMSRNRIANGLRQVRVAGRETLDGGVVEASGQRSAAEFAQLAQLINHAHGFLLQGRLACRPDGMRIDMSTNAWWKRVTVQRFRDPWGIMSHCDPSRMWQRNDRLSITRRCRRRNPG